MSGDLRTWRRFAYERRDAHGRERLAPVPLVEIAFRPAHLGAAFHAERRALASFTDEVARCYREIGRAADEAAEPELPTQKFCIL